MSIASDLTALEGYISDAYDAVSSKGGTIPANKNMSNLSTAIGSISGGGGSASVVNGVIGSFKASSTTIDANNFVNFVESSINSADNAIDSTSGAGAGRVGSAVIGTNKVFVVYNNSANLYGVVCTISGTTITAGTITTLATDAYNSSQNYAIRLEDDKVFVAYNKSASSYITGMVCTISGTTITAGTSLNLAPNTGIGNKYGVCALSSSSVAITYIQSGLKVVVGTINNTTITLGTVTTIVASSSVYSSCVPSVFYYGNNTIILDYTSPSPYTLYAIACTVSGTTVTTGTAAAITTGAYSTAKAQITGVAQGSVVISFATSAGSGYSNLYFTAFTVSGTTISLGTKTLIKEDLGADPVYTAPVLNMTNNSVVVATTRTSKTALQRFFLKVVGKSVIFTGNIPSVSKVNQNAQESIAILGDSAVLVHGVGTSNTTLSGLVLELPEYMVDIPDTATKGSSIQGLTKTSCTSSTAGDVWVLEL